MGLSALLRTAVRSFGVNVMNMIKLDGRPDHLPLPSCFLSQDKHHLLMGAAQIPSFGAAYLPAEHLDVPLDADLQLFRLTPDNRNGVVAEIHPRARVSLMMQLRRFDDTTCPLEKMHQQSTERPLLPPEQTVVVAIGPDQSYQTFLVNMRYDDVLREIDQARGKLHAYDVRNNISPATALPVTPAAAPKGITLQ